MTRLQTIQRPRADGHTHQAQRGQAHRGGHAPHLAVAVSYTHLDVYKRQAAGDARRGGQTEQLLQAHGEHRRVFRVVDGDARAGRHAQRARRQLVEALRQRPGQQRLQDRRQVEIGEVAEAVDLAQEGRCLLYTSRCV